jgi:hypothetical protein
LRVGAASKEERGDIGVQRHSSPEAAHPERFGNRRPQAPKLPKAAWINQPSPEAPHTSRTAGR